MRIVLAFTDDSKNEPLELREILYENRC